jgi:hypothetical protein
MDGQPINPINQKEENETLSDAVVSEEKPAPDKKGSTAQGPARSNARGDALFFPMLLATRKAMEQESRKARISSLSIV